MWSDPTENAVIVCETVVSADNLIIMADGEKVPSV